MNKSFLLVLNIKVIYSVGDRMKRILHVVSALEVGGAEMMIMDIYRRINHDEWQFDFVSHGLKEGEFEPEVRKLGGRVFRITSLGMAGPIVYIKQLVKIMKNGHYEAVHIHTDFQGGIVALAACLAKVKIRICHSHSTNWNRDGRGVQELGLRALKKLIYLFANQYCACSQEAGHFLFGEKSKKLHILHNAVHVGNYQSLGEVNRQSERKMLGIHPDDLIIGHVGRFSESKNQVFILKLVQHLRHQGVKATAILVGDGPLKRTVEIEAERLGISESVLFPGIRSDIPYWMHLFDVFAFPSLFEGFGIAALEAQCAGTSCVVSDRVPVAVDTGLGLLTYLKLEEPIQKWADAMIKSSAIPRPNLSEIHKHFLQNGFDIENSVKQWEKLYMRTG